MNKKDLFNKAIIKANILPEIIDTPAMRRQVMMAVVAEWLWQLDDVSARPEAHASILTMASDTLTMINDHLYNRYERN
jgi:hypothetical protein